MASLRTFCEHTGVSQDLFQHCVYDSDFPNNIDQQTLRFILDMPRNDLDDDKAIELLQYLLEVHDNELNVLLPTYIDHLLQDRNSIDGQSLLNHAIENILGAQESTKVNPTTVDTLLDHPQV